MRFDSICKFSSSSGISDFTISCFVLETEIDVMKSPKKLKQNTMILVEQGSGSFLFDGVSYPFSQGTLIFGFEKETFSLEKGEDISYFYINFTGIRSTDLLNRFGIFPHMRIKDNYNGLIPLFKHSLVNTPQDNIDIASEGLLLYVFSQLDVNYQVQNDVIQKIIKLTNEHFRDHDMSIAIIAKEMGYNTKYLSHFFKQNMKLSYSEYLRSVRLKYAISLFDLGLSSVKNVAILSGFSDPLYFSNTFKKSLGLSPSDYIEKHKKTKED